MDPESKVGGHPLELQKGVGGWEWRVEMLENWKQIRIQYKAMSDIVNTMSAVIDWPKQVAAAAGVKRE